MLNFAYIARFWGIVPQKFVNCWSLLQLHHYRMRRLASLLIAFLAAGTLSLSAQRLDQDLSSLATLPNDSQRVQVLNRISEALLQEYPDSAMGFVAQAMTIGRNVNFAAGQTRARLNQALVAIAKGNFDDADAALKICESEFAQQHNMLGLADCALAHGRIAVQQKSWNLALSNCHKADSLFALDTLQKPGPDLLRGQVFQELGSYDLASGFYQTAQRIADHAGDQRGRALAAESLAGLMLLQGRNDSARVQYNTAFEAWKAAGDRLGQMGAFTGMGTALTRAGKPETGAGFLEDAIALARDDRARSREGLALIRLAEADVKLGLPDSAQKHCAQALVLLRNQSDPGPALDARIGIVQAALIRSDYGRAQRHGDTAIAIADSFKLFRPMYVVNQLLYKAYQVQGDYRRALNYFQVATAAKDSMQRGKERNQVLAMQVKMADELAFEGRQMNAKAAETADQLSQDLSQTRLFLFLALGAFVLASAGLVFYMRSANRRGKQIAGMLSEKEEELGESKQELSRVSARLEATDIDYEAIIAERTETLQDAVESLIAENESLQEFIYHSSNDLLGPVARLKGLVLVAKGSGQVKDFVQAIDLIDNVTVYLDKVLQKLLLVHEIKHGFRDIQPVNLEDLLAEIRPKLKEIPGVKYPDLRFQDHLKRPIMIDRNLMRVILENLLENACVFRKDPNNDSPLIEVMLKKEDEDIYISIRDEGVGIPNEIRDKIFDLFFRGNERSKGNGIGLFLVQRALREIGGRIMLESKEGMSTEFIVRFHELEG
jgi:signal transduction histidine kinase